MTTHPPKRVADQIKQRTYEEADKINYLAIHRIASGEFLNRLVDMEDIGVVLARYMPRESVRTYIKDAILNRYSKDKHKDAKPTNLRAVIKNAFDVDTADIGDTGATDIALWKSVDKKLPDQFVVVADGTYLKWETALRKALLYPVGKPFASRTNNKIFILLILFARKKRVTDADKKHLQKALGVCNAVAHIYGET